jgi:hypothetical protein
VYQETCCQLLARLWGLFPRQDVGVMKNLAVTLAKPHCFLSHQPPDARYFEQGNADAG